MHKVFTLFFPLPLNPSAAAHGLCTTVRRKLNRTSLFPGCPPSSHGGGGSGSCSRAVFPSRSDFRLFADNNRSKSMKRRNRKG